MNSQTKCNAVEFGQEGFDREFFIALAYRATVLKFDEFRGNFRNLIRNCADEIFNDWNIRGEA